MFEISDLRRETLHLSSVCPPGGAGTLICSYICRLWLFFEVLNFEFQYFGVFQKTEFFFFFLGGGYEDFVDFFLGGGWGSSQNYLYLGVISMHLGSFLKVKVQNGGCFWVAKISNIYLGCLKFLIFFLVNSRCWARAYMYEEKMRATPLLGFVHQFKHIPVKCI